MSIKFRLTAMQFLQFFVWGAWLISLGGYMGGTLHFEGGQIGAIFATMRQYNKICAKLEPDNKTVTELLTDKKMT